MCSPFCCGIGRVKVREGNPWNVLWLFAKGFLSSRSDGDFLLPSTGTQTLRVPWGNGQPSGAEAYVFLLCWKKAFAAQKCDLLHDKWDHAGSEFSEPLSDAQAEPALGMHNWTGVFEQVASMKGQRSRGRTVSWKGMSLLYPQSPARGRAPWTLW